MTEFNRNLNHRQLLFHGTIADIPDMVRPVGRGNASVHSSQGYRWGQRSDEHAFATEKEDEAWRYAEMAQRGPKRKGDGPLGHNRPDIGRARVYRVAPAPDQQMGAYHPDHPRHAKLGLETWHEHLSKTGFPVRERIDIKPGHQGTFPIDWRPYSKHPGAEVNHPNAETVLYGSSQSTGWLERVHEHHRTSREFYELGLNHVPEPPKREEVPGQQELFPR